MTRRERRHQVEERVVAFLPLVRRLTGRWSREFPWLEDDFRSDALLALLRAAKTWQPGGGAKQTTYFWSRIVWSLHKRLRIEKAKNRTAFAPQIVPVSRDDTDARDSRDPLLIPDGAPAVGTAAAEDEAVERLLAPLSPKLRRVLTRRVLDGALLSDLAAEHGTNRKRIQEMYDEAVRVVREAVGVAG